MKDQEVQTKEEDKCICKEECNVSRVQYDEDKVICVLNRAKCSEEKWEELEEKVKSKMDLEALLKDWGRVLETADRLRKKSYLGNMNQS